LSPGWKIICSNGRLGAVNNLAHVAVPGGEDAAQS